MNNFFIVFFQLGGVFIVLFNRMFEEFEKVMGGYYLLLIIGGFVERVLGYGKSQYGELFGKMSDFVSFLEVLKV